MNRENENLYNKRERMYWCTTIVYLFFPLISFFTIYFVNPNSKNNDRIATRHFMIVMYAGLQCIMFCNWCVIFKEFRGHGLIIGNFYFR